MAARLTTRDVTPWAQQLQTVGRRIGPHLARSQPRRRAVGSLRRLLGDAERNNGGQHAEYRGETTPHGVQHRLARAAWDADAVRDDVTQYGAEHADERGWQLGWVVQVGVGVSPAGRAGADLVPLSATAPTLRPGVPLKEKRGQTA